MIRAAWRAALLCCAAASAGGATPPAASARVDAAQLFRLGQWAAAAEAGRAERTAASLAVAAHADLIRAVYFTPDRKAAMALVLQGENDADAALAIDPRNFDALFQRASGIGYRSTLLNSPHLALETHRILEGLTKSNPDRAEGWLGLGAWNGESVDTLGRMMAGMVLGAKLSGMEAGFAKAEALWATNPVPFAYHAMLLLRMDAGNATRARALLETAVRNRPREAYEAQAHDGAAEMLAALRQGDVKGARALARRLGPFGKLS